MSEINQIVNVTITRENARVTRVGFGTPLVIGVSDAFAERVRTYSNITAVGVDYGTTTEEYLMANMLFSQALSPTSILIGRRLATVAQQNDITIAGTVLEDEVFTAVIDRVTYTYTALTTPTPTTVAAGLAALINAATNLAAANVAGVITVDPIAIPQTFLISSVSTDSVGATIVASPDGASTIEAIATTLDAINLENSDYYGLLVAKRGVTADSVDDISEAATAAEARKKLYLYSTDEATAITASTADIFSTLQALSRDRSAGIYSATDYEYPEAGWMGLQFPKSPGSTNWKFKTISGATPSTLTDTAITNLKAKNANFIETVGGRNLTTSEGVVASGEYIDVIRGIDSTIQEIAEDTFAYLASQDKVPFTNPGMIATAGPISTVLNRKADLGVFVKSSILVNIPDVTAVSASDKANRQFTGTTFSAQLQGAINYVTFVGVVYT